MLGEKVPSFDLPSTSGKNISDKDFVGKSKLVIFFYPKDNTPG